MPWLNRTAACSACNDPSHTCEHGPRCMPPSPPPLVWVVARQMVGHEILFEWVQVVKAANMPASTPAAAQLLQQALAPVFCPASLIKLMSKPCAVPHRCLCTCGRSTTGGVSGQVACTSAATACQQQLHQRACTRWNNKDNKGDRQRAARARHTRTTTPCNRSARACFPAADGATPR